MEPVRVEYDGAVAVVTLDDPQRRNALSSRALEALKRIVPDLTTDDAVRAIVLTGSGDAFCSGGDVADMPDPSTMTSGEILDFVSDLHVWVQPLLESDTPVITAVNGPAVGGGLGVALLGDVVLASDDAFFMCGYSSLGLMPDIGLLTTVPQAIGSIRAKELLLLNRRYSAPEAVQAGLVTKCVPRDDLLDEALAIARRLATGPRSSIRMTLRMLRHAFSDAPEDYFQREALSQVVAFASPEFSEGITAFRAKRRPDFMPPARTDT